MTAANAAAPAVTNRATVFHKSRGAKMSTAVFAIGNVRTAATPHRAPCPPPPPLPPSRHFKMTLRCGAETQRELRKATDVLASSTPAPQKQRCVSSFRSAQQRRTGRTRSDVQDGPVRRTSQGEGVREEAFVYNFLRVVVVGLHQRDAFDTLQLRLPLSRRQADGGSAK